MTVGDLLKKIHFTVHSFGAVNGNYMLHIDMAGSGNILDAEVEQILTNGGSIYLTVRGISENKSRPEGR